MKTKNIIRICGIAALSAMTFSSCSDVLDEQPRSGYDPSYFTTVDGVKGGLTSLYAHLRNVYGQAYYFTSCEAGTDEYTWGHSADGNQKDIDMSGVGNLSSTTVRSDALWGQAFTEINTASSVIYNASAVGIAPDLVAEAYFFRGFYYFNLVQTFGGVPLDLGSGELKPNASTKRTSKRNTVDEVYEKAVFPDLEKAVESLPNKSRAIGTVTKTTARLYLAKAYLTYAWWLENPNNIDTYPATTKRDKSQAEAYFQKAYKIAKEAIDDNEESKVYGLQPTYYDVNFWQNDRNNEWLLWADHTVNSDQYNGGGLGWGNGGAPENFAGWFTQWNYCGDMKGYTELNEKGEPIYFNPVLREACQALGRPWTRMAPIPDALKKFTDVDKDSRWDGTFTYQYRVNMAKGGNKNDFVYGAGGSKLKNGDIYLQFLPYDAEGVVYNQNNATINAGVLAGHPEFVINISDVSRQTYPGVWKHIGHRTDRNEATELGNPNGSSPRPFVIAKFSELYFVAAEAAVKLGKNDDARSNILKIRERAGKWKTNFNDYTYLVSNTGYNDLKVVKDYSEEMKAATPQQITIDYILDERLREYWGEGYRWFDLVRTQTWEKMAGVYHISDGCGREAKEVKRDIKKHYYLRPIPQGQLDALQMDEAEKKAYQNPGY
ncbi:MAG: RagB/SusD family nutrient uptake outer membrane protein [Bacteroidaceae bacterium]|nr:RagB/SusD family nutrient uptake outer membrane protein [Bacteroidaceae bacterium]